MPSSQHHPSTPVVRHAAAVLALAAAVAACQPVDAPPPRDDSTDDLPAPDATAEPGAPATSRVPQSLDGLTSQLETVAQEWQADPVMAEIHVSLADTTWTQALVTYVAADADRLLVVDVSADGMSQQRPTFSTLGLQPISAAGVEELPALPDAAQDPQELAAAAAPLLDECGYDSTVASVLYASGAPVAWDGERWTEEPAWTATVATPDGDSVLLDPVSGALAREDCL